MQYVNTIIQSSPILVLLVFWGARGLPLSWFAVLLLASTCTGIVWGQHRAKTLIMRLVKGDGHFQVRRAPGGVWFFVGLGLFGALTAAAIVDGAGETVGMPILRASATAIGALLCASYWTMAIAVLRFEHAKNKQLWLGPGGFDLLPAGESKL
ncbi:MAG TPA: hypothetical protein VL992_07925 [Tepidisphaeraceae bacterium]|nr:hypothetical protein [Tepidisphaeraceae bacterium]